MYKTGGTKMTKENKLLTFDEWLKALKENNISLNSEDVWGKYSQYEKNHKHFWELDSNSNLSIFNNYEYLNELENFMVLGKTLGLDALVEVHDKEDIEKIKGLDIEIMGINRSRSSFNRFKNVTDTGAESPAAPCRVPPTKPHGITRIFAAVLLSCH